MTRTYIYIILVVWLGFLLNQAGLIAGVNVALNIQPVSAADMSHQLQQTASTPTLDFTIEVEPNSVDDTGQATPGTTLLTIVTVFNDTNQTIFAPLFIATIPNFTVFDRNGSDERWGLTAVPPGSASHRPCPDGHLAGQTCVISLDALQPSERVTTIRFAVDINEALPTSLETLMFGVDVVGSLEENGALNFMQNASINVPLVQAGTSLTNPVTGTVDPPTSLPVMSEPVIEGVGAELVIAPSLEQNTPTIYLPLVMQ
ncbi:MAG: hypothetical protein AAF639_24620 [Chloroflexota bacterium]